MNYEQKQLIKAFANEAQRLYDFSLCVPEKTYTDIDIIAERMGGGIEYLDSVSEPEVARCRNGFILRLPLRQKTKAHILRYYFAQGLAILFFGLKYQIDDSFVKRRNMEFYSIHQFGGSRSQDYENMLELTKELYLPANYLRQMVDSHCDENKKFSISIIADILSMDSGYVENRLVELGMIKHWTER